MRIKILAAKILTICMVCSLVLLNSVSQSVKASGIPVIDTANLVESVAQTVKQIDEYRTQLQQYTNMLQNTMAPAAYIWDQAQITINNLVTAIDTVNYYKTLLGDLPTYLNQFKDLSYYQSSPCFSGAGCSPSDLAALANATVFAAKAQKKANDSLVKGLDAQQGNLQNDARQLERIQAASQGAGGHLEAIQYASQLASQQANQLLQIRALLIAQQSADSAKMQADLDAQSRTQAASMSLRSGNVSTSSPATTWGF